MDRIFQNESGEIHELVGSRFTKVVSLDDMDTGNVVVVWLKESISEVWYRIFIDGHYCGIDQYKIDCIINDMDDHIKATDISDEFSNDTVTMATVTNNIQCEGSIQLELRFKESSFTLVCKDENGFCTRAFG